MATTTRRRETTALPYSGDSRQLPWDVMGGDLTQKHDTVASALEEKGLDFTVDMRPVFSQDAQGASLEAKNLRAAVRPMPDGSEAVMAVTGKRFTPIQNRDAFAVGDHLVREFGATISGLADFRGGGASLLVLDMPTTIHLEGANGFQEDVNLHLLAKNAHDASSALTFALTAIRPTCTNALPAAIRDAKRVWKINHTPNAQARVDLARHSILAALTYADAFQAKAQEMLDAAMVDREFDKIVERLWPVAEDKRETKAGQNRLEVREAVQTLYRTSDTLDGIRGTRWGGYNAVTEYLDWGREVRTGAVGRAEGALEGPYVRTKAKVWETFAGAR